MTLFEIYQNYLTRFCPGLLECWQLFFWVPNKESIQRSLSSTKGWENLSTGNKLSSKKGMKKIHQTCIFPVTTVFTCSCPSSTKVDDYCLCGNLLKIMGNSRAGKKSISWEEWNYCFV